MLVVRLNLTNLNTNDLKTLTIAVKIVSCFIEIFENDFAFYRLKHKFWVKHFLHFVAGKL